MATYISHSPEETAAFAAALATQAEPGWLIGLVGDLGAGKTQFVKGFARGLQIKQPVLSPTFALLHSYDDGRLPLVHIDFYRLDNDEQILAAGLGEYFVTPGVTIIEWWDRWRGPAPAQLRRFVLQTLSDSERQITYDIAGS